MRALAALVFLTGLTGCHLGVYDAGGLANCYSDLNNDFCIVHHLAKDDVVVSGSTLLSGLSGAVATAGTVKGAFP